MNGTFAVARYTLLELSRRRLLLVFFVVGAAGLALLGTVLKIATSVIGTNVVVGGPPGTPQPDPAQVQQVIELGFVSDLIGALSIFALLIAFAIGMTAIYHDLESGAAVSIFSKPLSRFAFTAGKVTAAIVAMIVIVGVLSIEARLLMFLFGGGLEQALWVETLTSVANAVLLMLLVLALSTWMNNIIAAVVAFIYNVVVAAIVVSLHQGLVAGALGDNWWIHGIITAAYWLVPHALRSDAQREIAKKSFEIFNTGPNAPPADQVVATIPGASDLTDIVWWLFVVAVFATLVYVAVRRRQV